MNNRDPLFFPASHVNLCTRTFYVQKLGKPHRMLGLSTQLVHAGMIFSTILFYMLRVLCAKPVLIVRSFDLNSTG